MLSKRIITAFVLIPLLILVVWFDRPLPWFAMCAAVWGGLAVLEFYRMVGTAGIWSLTWLGVAWTMLLIISPYVTFPGLLPVLITSAVVFSLLLLLLRKPGENQFRAWAWTLAGMLYVGWLLSYLVALRMDAGRNWLLLALLLTFASDTTAFFVGRAWGKHRMAPSISPRKTWEGAAGGVLGAMAAALLFTLPSPLQLPLSYAGAIGVGMLVAGFGQVGDLAESLMKRSAGAKESGNLLPGHGGLLDRTDSVAFAGIAVYYFFLIFHG